MQRLPEEVKSLIRTGVALPSVTQVVEELLLNSVDAGASNIAVRVDLSCFKIQVVDNGHGITKDQFELIGERYATSKCHSAKDLETLKHYGYRGEALASIILTSSFLEIVSRSKGTSVTFSKCFHRGKQSLVSKLSSCRPSVGTTITVHDLFYNLPVRQSKSNFVIEMEKIRCRVSGLALMWPNITISLRNDSLGQILLQTKKCSSTIGVFCSLFTTRPNDLMELSAEKDDLSLWGFISRESHSQKDVQFVYINKRLVLNSYIHKLVNRILRHSSITKRRDQSQADMSASSGSPSKYADSYGIFLLNITCPFHFYDITFDPQKTLVEFSNYKKLSDTIQDVIYSLLRRENLYTDESFLLKVDSEQRETTTDVAQPTNSLQPVNEKTNGAGISNISHSDILYSKPVKKCNKNLLHSFDNSNGLDNQKDEDLSLQLNEENKSTSVPEKASQPTILKGKNDDSTLIDYTNREETIDSNLDFELPHNKVGVKMCGVSSSIHQNISEEISGVKNSGLFMENPRVRKKPELSRISMDKSVKYVSTLSCLREFSASKKCKYPTNNLDINDKFSEIINTTDTSSNININNISRINTLSELKNATKPPASDKDCLRINTLTELKNASKSSKYVDNVPNIRSLTKLESASTSANFINESGIHTLTELKNATRTSTNYFNNVPMIDTLTELKKATQSSTNVDIELRTPCTSDRNSNGEDVIFNHSKQNRQDKHHDCIITDDEVTHTQMPHTLYTKSDACMIETPCSESLTDKPFTFSHLKDNETPVNSNQVITMKTGKKVVSDSLEMACIPFSSPKTLFINHAKEDAMSDEADKNNENYFYRNTAVGLKKVETTKSFASHSLNSFSAKSSPSPHICPENDTLDQAGDSIMVEDHRPIDTISPNCIISTKESLVPFQHEAVSCKDPIDLLPTSKYSQERNMLDFSEVNTKKKIDNIVSVMQHAESFDIASDVLLKGTFNLKSLMRQRTTQSMDSSPKYQNQLSLTRNDKQFNLQVSIRCYPSSSTNGRKRKLLGMFELSADVPSPKKFNFEKDCFHYFHMKFLPSSILLKQLLAPSINRSVLISEWQSTSPSYVKDKCVNNRLMSTESLEKTLCKSVTPSNFNSIEIKYNPSSTSNLEKSGAFKETKELKLESLVDDKTSEDCLQNGQLEIISHPFNSQGVPFDWDLQKRLSLSNLDVITSEVGLFDIGQDSDLSLISSDKIGESSDAEKRDVTAKNFFPDPSKCLEIDHWKNPVFKKHKLPCLPLQLCPNEGTVAKTCYSFINGLEFTGGMLQSAKVIGQVEMKFIACIIEKPDPSNVSDRKLDLLVLFDQHAVHERVRLETLTKDAEETNGDIHKKLLKRAQLNPPVTLPISKDDARIVKAFQTEFQRIGVEFLLHESTHNMQFIVIHSLPLCMTQRDIDGKQREEEEITRNAKDLIQEHIQLLKATNGVLGRIPLAVHRVLCSQACRGAIKFGDPVSLATCKQLMKQLSECRLPFQCAHGRPSVVPLVNLRSLESQNKRTNVKPELRKISQYFKYKEDVTM